MGKMPQIILDERQLIHNSIMFTHLLSVRLKCQIMQRFEINPSKNITNVSPSPTSSG
jgi:hypothetical protein